MASLRTLPLPGTKHLIACFTDATGRRRQRSTGTHVRKDARHIADEYEATARARKTETQIRQVMTDLFKEGHGTSLVISSVENFLEDWLKRKEAEAVAPGPGSGFMRTRLTELLLAEVFRDRTLVARLPQTGLLAGLADPVTARALAALHAEVARPWTTAALARLCGCSRSGLSERFSRLVGVAPMGYLRQWRLVVARDELRRGRLSVAEIAGLVGFRSGSALSTAFMREAGCSPKQYAKDGKGI